MTRHLHVPPSVEGDARVCALHKEAAEGKLLAQLTLARSYREGNGAPQNAAAALYWFRRVAKREPSYLSSIAALAIGEMYRTGEGVTRNYKRALWKGGWNLGPFFLRHLASFRVAPTGTNRV